MPIEVHYSWQAANFHCRFPLLVEDPYRTVFLLTRTLTDHSNTPIPLHKNTKIFSQEPRIPLPRAEIIRKNKTCLSAELKRYNLFPSEVEKAFPQRLNNLTCLPLQVENSLRVYIIPNTSIFPFETTIRCGVSCCFAMCKS